MPGAPDFVVRAANETGADLLYLTGRETLTRAEATRRQLLYYGFPLDGEHSQLLTRGPKESPIDSIYKAAIIKRVMEKYTIVGVFDDNLNNAIMFRDALPNEIPVVRPNKNVADTKGVKNGIEQITTYLFNVSFDKAGKRSAAANKTQLDAILKRIKSNAASTKG